MVESDQTNIQHESFKLSNMVMVKYPSCNTAYFLPHQDPWSPKFKSNIASLVYY